MKKYITYKVTIIILLFIIASLSGFIVGYIISDTSNSKKIKRYQNELTILQQKIEKLSKEINNSKTPPALTFQTNTEYIDYVNTKKILNKPEKNTSSKKIEIKKPKLVLIIDDVAFKYEVDLIKKIPFHITPSFFPPTPAHPNTPLYAKEFPCYMVHLPLQAFNFPKPEPNTLTVNSSLEQIEQRISLIKKEFPNVHFINNHTGSKFTSNYNAMNKLFFVLKENNINFVDSKTTPISQSKDVNKIYHLTLFSRDIFLDNKQDKNYILNQLKKAINIAKKRGYAIAIGHPHKITLETLKDAKNLLSQVDVIYIDKLSKYVKN